MANASSTAAGVKRKRHDPTMQTITLDPHYDLVLITGTPEHADGQKAFQVNKGSMRHVSDIWSKMLSGDWAESKMTEIDFPDDSWKPFEIVLKITHFQIAALPDSLSFDELQELAILTDKYSLTKAVRVGLDLKQWLHEYRDEWTYWPSLPSTQQFAFMTSVFQYDSDLAFLTSKLAVEVQVEDGVHLCHGNDTDRTRLLPRLPDLLLANIKKARDEMLWQLIECCKLAIANATRPDSKTPCEKDQCAVMKAGILITDLTSAGLFPLPADTKELHMNVLSYWRAVRCIGAKHKDYQPCDKVSDVHSRSYSTSFLHGANTRCCFDRCFEDFGIQNAARTMLQQRVHADVYAHLRNDMFIYSEY